MSSAKWRVHTRQKPDLLGHLLALRGFEPADLTFDFNAQLHDPNLLPGMKTTRELIKTAVKGNWPVTIFGDYDADGTPAAALLATSLQRLGLKTEVIIPTRAEGYGLNLTVIDDVAKHSKLLITIDTGVTAVAEIKRAKKLGLAVIVIDHHLPKKELPPADAIVDPFLPDSLYPFQGLCACALAYKVVEALGQDFPTELTESWRKWLLDLVAISTVADMMPMINENRVLVHYGLWVLKKNRRPGLQAMLAAGGIDPDKLSAGALGFKIGPRLNASGRMGDNRPAYDLLVSQNSDEATVLAGRIEEFNRERQALVEQVLFEAQQLLFKQNNLADHCFIVSAKNWPTGVIGLVAGKIAGQFNRPTIVLTCDVETLTGSARSSGDYSIIDGLTSQEHHLIRFGGHRQAAGLSLAFKSLPKFVDGLKAHALANIPEALLVKSYLADAILDSNEIDLSTVAITDQFQPFGIDNHQPLFVIENVELVSARFIGASGDHVKWRGRKGSLDLDIIGFGMAERLKKNPINQAHLLGHLEKNVWNDQARLQLRLVDFQPTETPIEFI